MAWRVLGQSLKELRVHLCQSSKSSQGVRDFIEKHYVELKTANPSLPILVRECTGVEPKLYGRYEHGREVCVPLTDQTSQQVMDSLQYILH